MSAEFSPHDWNFDDVPPAEWVACCLWEYARESVTLLTATQAAWRKDGQNFVWERSGEAQAAIRRVLKQPSGHTVPLYELLAIFDGRPWLSLSSAKRAESAALLRPAAPPLRPATLEEVEALAAANRLLPRENLERLRQAGVPQSDLTGDKIQNPPSARVAALQLRRVAASPKTARPAGWFVFAVTADLSRYTDRRLAEAFERLLASARPPQFRSPKEVPEFPVSRGRKLSDWRAALNRLGIMRALHVYPFADHRFPKPFKDRGEKHCYAARKAALQTFRSLFPTLPKSEAPLAWRTKGGRSR